MIVYFNNFITKLIYNIYYNYYLFHLYEFFFLHGTFMYAQKKLEMCHFMCKVRNHNTNMFQVRFYIDL